MSEISVKALKEILDNKEKIQILDVREPSEYLVSNLGGIFIPLRELPHRLEELNPDEPIAVLCHSGVRSAHATFLLKQAGFNKVFNITGGIVAWSGEIDPTLPIG